MHTQILRVLCGSHHEATYLAEHSHGLGVSEVLLLLQVTPGQPLPLQHCMKTLQVKQELNHVRKIPPEGHSQI